MAIEPTGLECGNTIEPLGVDLSRPRLSWRYSSDKDIKRGWTQSRFCVLVSRSRQELERDIGDLWNSGPVDSAESNVNYNGPTLPSSTRMYWKVMAWDTDGKPTPWSPISSWVSGLLPENEKSAGEWKASWITAPTDQSALPLFRKSIQVRPGLTAAYIHICGLGHYELRANGKKAGDALLAPGWTKYDKTCLYDTLDLTPLLTPGDNTLGVLLGNGMYNVTGGRYTKFKGTFGPPKLIAQLVLIYADGTRDIIGTDESWKTTPGPITFSCVFGGEDFDARRIPQGWDRSGFDDQSWTASRKCDAPAGPDKSSSTLLRGQSFAAPPIREIQQLKPISMRQIVPGTTVYDLGQNAAIMPRLQVHGPSGSFVRITPAELLDASGNLNRRSVGNAPSYWQYTLQGPTQTSQSESWDSRFTYHGARYLRVECFPAEPGCPLPIVDNLSASVIQSDVPSVGEFECSNSLFNQIHTITRWAQRSNLVSVLTDCPHRERLGWLEQYHLHGPSLRYEFDLNTFFAKTLQDMADSQTADGLIPDIAPEYVVFKGGFRDSPEWGSAAVLVPWQQWEFTGNPESLSCSYPMMKRYAEYLHGKAKNHLLAGGLGDWYDIGPKPPGQAQLTPKDLTATAFYYEVTRVLAQAAAVLGLPDDARQYAVRADDIKAAFNRKYLNPATGVYAECSQAGQAIPLVMGLVPEELRSKAVDALVENVQAAGLTAGDIGHRYLLRALADAGRSDLIFKLHSTSDRPGYGWMLAKGATTLTEAWDARPDSSHNHFMLGHINEWFFTNLLGIHQTPNSVGFRHILLQPTPAGDVTSARGSYRSVNGAIISSWKIAGNEWHWDVEIPIGSKATLIFPAIANLQTLTVDGRPLADAAGLRPGSDSRTLEVVSGRYSFKTK